MIHVKAGHTVHNWFGYRNSDNKHRGYWLRCLTCGRWRKQL